jgi:hypothetical protein
MALLAASSKIYSWRWGRFSKLYFSGMKIQAPMDGFTAYFENLLQR